jgi:uncharacterized membrane protein
MEYRDRTDGMAGAGSRENRSSASFLWTVGLGAALMYWFDPRTGRRRRALLRDQLVHAGRVIRDAERVTQRDLTNRIIGVRAQLTRPLHAEPASDPELCERVRAKLGRFVSHPHAVEVTARDGRVILGGPILAREVPPLLNAVEHVPGVRVVENRLQVHEQAGRISALQGGQPRMERAELMQDNWSPTARLVTGALGASLMAMGMRSRGPASLVAALLGGGLVMRAATNRNMATLVGVGPARHGITVQKTMHIDAPLRHVFEFWANFENFPRFMSHVRKVRVLDERRSLWLVQGPAGVPVEWTTEITRVEPNALIEWQTEPASPVQHSGSVRFEQELFDGTRVDVRLTYVPPAGVLGHAVAALFGADPKHEMDDDLMRFKTAIETGRPPHDAAQPGGAPALAATGALGVDSETLREGQPL